MNSTHNCRVESSWKIWKICRKLVSRHCGTRYTGIGIPIRQWHSIYTPVYSYSTVALYIFTGIFLFDGGDTAPCRTPTMQILVGCLKAIPSCSPNYLSHNSFYNSSSSVHCFTVQLVLRFLAAMVRLEIVAVIFLFSISYAPPVSAFDGHPTVSAAKGNPTVSATKGNPT